MTEFIEYSPILIAVIVFLLQHKLFVTPELLERRHREILSEIELRYAKIDAVSDIKEQVVMIDEKITKLYEAVLKALA